MFLFFLNEDALETCKSITLSPIVRSSGTCRASLDKHVERVPRVVIEQENCHCGLEKPSLAYGFASIFLKVLYKGAGEMDWDFEDTHLEIKNMKNQED